MTDPYARSLAAAYVFEPALHRQAHEAGCNYWYRYVDELCDRLGLSVRRITPNEVTRDALADLGVLLLGDFPAGVLDAAASAALEQWVYDGGVLIGFGTQDLDSLFGVR